VRTHLTPPRFAVSRETEQVVLPLAQPPKDPSPQLPTEHLEVLGFPAWLFSGLPLPTGLRCARNHGAGLLVLASTDAAPAGGAGEPSFVHREVDALVLGAEHERASWVEVEAWCARKRQQGDWRLTNIEALGGVREDPLRERWSIGRVLHALGLRLHEVLT